MAEQLTVSTTSDSIQTVCSVIEICVCISTKLVRRTT